MQTGKVLALFILAVTLGATRLAAQQDAQPGEDSDIESGGTTPATETGAQSNVESDVAKQATPPRSETGDNLSPHDYRSSEEISEDRSVSFPVDI